MSAQHAGGAVTTRSSRTDTDRLDDRPRPLTVEFCGQRVEVTTTPFTVGRVADFVIDDDNRFIHRRFLEFTWSAGVWCVTNVGQRLTATISAAGGQLEAYLAPGATLPIVVAHHLVWFTAGPTTYEFTVEFDAAVWQPTVDLDESALTSGDTTAGRLPLTPDQFRLILALAEPSLRNLDTARRGSRVPTSADAASRLGWTITKFNRKLDNVCQRFTALGVRGLHGEPGNLASDRRARLVEYALAARVVKPADIELLDTLETPTPQEGADDAPGEPRCD